MARPGFAVCSYDGDWKLDKTTGFQDFPIRRQYGTDDIVEYWNPTVRGVAVTYSGWYSVSASLRVSRSGSGTARFSFMIMPASTPGLYGATSLVDGSSFMHSGFAACRIDVGQSPIIRLAVDGYTDSVSIASAQMTVRWLGGL